MRMRKIILQFGAVILFVCIILISSISWASHGGHRIFVQIEGIDGESVDSNHSGWIEALAFTGGVSHTSSIFSGGGTSERAEFEDVKIFKHLDKATPALYVSSAEGAHIPEVVIEITRPGESSSGDVKYFEIRLTNVIVSRVETSVTEEVQIPIETVILNYGRIEWTYTVMDHTGQPSGTVSGGWDLEQNKRI